MLRLAILIIGALIVVVVLLSMFKKSREKSAKVYQEKFQKSEKEKVEDADFKESK